MEAVRGGPVLCILITHRRNLLLWHVIIAPNDVYRLTIGAYSRIAGFCHQIAKHAIVSSTAAVSQGQHRRRRVPVVEVIIVIIIGVSGAVTPSSARIAA